MSFKTFDSKCSSELMNLMEGALGDLLHRGQSNKKLSGRLSR